MEEDKAAAYYEELTRKGEGAARFKQGLGFSSSTKSSSPDTITKGSALPSSSSFLSSFVKASSPTKSPDINKQVQLENIQNKLKKKHTSDRENPFRVAVSRGRDDRDRSSKRRSRSRDRYDSNSSRRDRDRDRDRGRSERRKRSRSRSHSEEERRHRRNSKERYGTRRRRSRSRSLSPRRRERSRDEGKSTKEKNGVDYSIVIKGYADMNPAERVKAKMKFQLSEAVEKDTDKGMGAGWERFQFNKDAPLDDEEIEAAEDDAAVVKKMGQSFRFSAVEARREEQIKAAHDQAMFGAPVAQPSVLIKNEPTIEDDKMDDDDVYDDKNGTSKTGGATNLFSDKVLAKQQGSWRDRARKLKDG